MALGPFGFNKGLNVKATTNTLDNDQMSSAQNVNLIGGSLSKRAGSRYLNTDAISGTPAITGITDWQTAAGQRYQVITAGAKIFQTADLGNTLTDITGAVTVTSGATNQSSFASLNNILVRCGGVTPDAPIKWTGTGNAAALGGTPPTGNICRTVNNFMFISGIAATPSRFFWSNVIDPETWPVTQYADFRASDGDKVTALSNINQGLVIFKRYSIGGMDTTTNAVSGTSALGAIVTLVNGIGCPGANALDNLPDSQVVFLGTNAHVYVFNGSYAQDISDLKEPGSNIQPWLDAIPPSRLQYAVVRYYPTLDQIWIATSLAGSGTNDVIYVYDYGLKVWTCKHIGIAANAMARCIDTRASYSHAYIMLTGNYGGRVFEQDYGMTNAEDATGNIDAYGIISKQLAAGGREFVPRSIEVVFDGQTGNSNLEIGYGFNDFDQVSKYANLSQDLGGVPLDTFLLDTDSLVGTGIKRKTVDLYADDETSSIQIRFRNQYAGQTFNAHPVYISEEILS